FMFELDDFSGQIALQIPATDVLLRGVKDWVDPAMIRRRLMKGQCRIVRSPEFQKVLPLIKLKPADTFLLFRFEKDILFQDLFNLSGIHEEEFYRLIYLFRSAGIVSLEEISQDQHAARPHRKTPAAHVPAAPAPGTAPPVAAVPLHAPAVSHDPATVLEVPAADVTHQAPPPEQESSHAAHPSPKPAEMAQDYFKLANQSYRNKNYWAAVEYCKKALELKKDVPTYLLMGNAFATHPNFRFEAMGAYKEALALDPDNPTIHRDMADLYFKTGNLALARSKYQDVLKLDPTDEHATGRLAAIAGKLKK
ncbi:MAG TPA: tetratricopeptide repeat protein, partial [Acidobacteriota bacterium]|nr:tetratricopeptide repeat protein [Acidobacteriota bacterium]